MKREEKGAVITKLKSVVFLAAFALSHTMEPVESTEEAVLKELREVRVAADQLYSNCSLYEM